jgi:divalent metal cation (Fe/Co/Zn/Cd) transporter
MSQGGAVAGGSTKVVVAALVGNALIAVTKFAAAAATGSSAMFAEAVHSVVDTVNQGLLLFGLGRAARPADPRHPFGYGKGPSRGPRIHREGRERHALLRPRIG